MIGNPKAGDVNTKAGNLTAELMDLDPEASALWMLRDRPDSFRQPEESYPDLARAAAGRTGELAARLAPELAACRAADAAASFTAQRRYWVHALTTTGGFVLALVSVITWSQGKGSAFGWVAAALAAIAVVAAALTMDEYGAAQQRWAARRDKYGLLVDAFEDAVAGLLRKIILERTPDEKKYGSLFDSRFAPTLVGIGIEKATSSTTYLDLVRFIADHPTSAIGIAGPRGVGKSTMMQQLIASDRASLGIRVPAPKRYEPGELVRLIHGTLAQEILQPGAGMYVSTTPTRGRRSLLVNVLKGFLFAVALVVLLFLWSEEQSSSSGASEWGVSTLTVFLFVAFGAWLGLFLRSLWRVLVDLRRGADAPFPWPMTPAEELRRLARAELAYLHFTETTQAKNGVRLKLGLFTLSGEDQVSVAERTATEADGVEQLRRFLRAVVRVTGSLVIICVDELDKMDRPEDVVAVVNGIKDLFHIRSVHVLVSVSTDAMHSFAARGVVVRDVFDSAFDEVVEVSRLTYQESAELLALRATDFSFPAMYFCHAWSGGHPRDLIRAARACVTYRAKQGEDGEKAQPVPLAEVVDAVLADDVFAMLRAVIEKLRSEDTTTTLVPDVIAFRDLLDEQDGPLHLRLRAAMNVADLPVIEGPASEATMLVQTLSPYLRLAALISEFFAPARPPSDWRFDSAPGARATSVRNAIDDLGDARVAMSGHPLEAERATRRAAAAVAATSPPTAAAR
ncbi:hypothetical protein SAMN05443287_12323 [Micromonospora phaseoli]|uniref:AAA+ ATPase domain-containing protein n=1 Tax=Micromonospora phaseoli TaxID=1144548 RepID=A0A1H7E8W7_9ACTN|nr:hypothetical protein [Micromonospora phaseoli]PZV88424.1 hypothetical protein CLV64_1204 [Micromonospora phaseoli]GIJ81280.1 hypothetical protein Xph01_57120 [Micromonospora phaseoli]SEK07035.1 hypothetical protein SAMN05443287_12323 [Micromonospora phaseoli]